MRAAAARPDDDEARSPPPMREIRRVYLHASDAPTRYGAADIAAWHLERGFRAIGYHLVIELHEGTWRAVGGRPVSDVGAHVRGDNARSYGICVCGRYETGPIPEAAWTLAVEAAALVCLAQGIDIAGVLGHRECGDVPGVPPTGKTCPGAAVDLDAWRAAVREAVEGLERLRGEVGA